MRTTHQNQWYRIGTGHYAMSTWVGNDQLTYRAVRSGRGWVVSKSVAGAALTSTLDNPTTTLREAKAIAEADWKTGLL